MNSAVDVDTDVDTDIDLDCGDEKEGLPCIIVLMYCFDGDKDGVKLKEITARKFTMNIQRNGRKTHGFLAVGVVDDDGGGVVIAVVMVLMIR